MSIVRGSSGRLTFTGSLLTAYDYTILLWLKDSSGSTQGSYLFYAVNESDEIEISQISSKARHQADLQFTTNAASTSAVTADVWYAISCYNTGVSNELSIYKNSTENNSTGLSGSFTAESSPTLDIFTNKVGSFAIATGTKIAAIAMFDVKYNTTVLAAFQAGENPLENHASDIIEFWDENTGIVKDGSDNLTTWTGLNGTVLTPSGTVTVDDVDMSPMDAPPSAGPVVDDVNTDEITVDGEQGVTFTTTGFTGEVTTLKVKSGTAITSATDITSSSGAGDCNIPDVSGYLVDTVGTPFTTTNNVIVYELGDGTDTAALAGTHNPKIGYAVVEIASAIKTKGSVFENFVGTIDDESEVYYSTAYTTSVSATGVIATDSTEDIVMHYWDVSDDTWKKFTVIIKEEGGGLPIEGSELSAVIVEGFEVFGIATTGVEV